jgi:hypothetical protein
MEPVDKTPEDLYWASAGEISTPSLEKVGQLRQAARIWKSPISTSRRHVVLN